MIFHTRFHFSHSPGYEYSGFKSTYTWEISSKNVLSQFPSKTTILMLKLETVMLKYVFSYRVWEREKVMRSEWLQRTEEPV